MSVSQSEYPVVVVLDDDKINKHWILDKDRVVLGREEICDIVIPERQISRQHACFRRQKDRYFIQDLDSKNGTWVNGNRLEGSVELSDGDEIHVALSTRLRFIGSGVTAPITTGLPDVIPSLSAKGRLRINTEARQVIINGKEIDPPLSLPQYRLLELLYLNSGRICTRDAVIEAVWPEAMGEGVSEQAIDALVRRLRDRLTEYDEDWQYVITVRGHGFRLTNPEE